MARQYQASAIFTVIFWRLVLIFALSFYDFFQARIGENSNQNLIHKRRFSTKCRPFLPFAALRDDLCIRIH